MKSALFIQLATAHKLTLFLFFVHTDNCCILRILIIIITFVLVCMKTLPLKQNENKNR